jgi:hypothetical protein
MKPGKLVPKVLNNAESSASKGLKGVQTKFGKIRKVVKSKGDWRIVIYDNNTMQYMTKDYVKSARTAVGRKTYMDKMQTQSGIQNSRQIMKSFWTRRTQAEFSGLSRKRVDELLQDYENKVRQLGMDQYSNEEFKNLIIRAHPTPSAFSIPRQYGEPLGRGTKGLGSPHEVKVMKKQPEFLPKGTKKGLSRKTSPFKKRKK